MSSVMPSTSGPNDGNKKVKKEGKSSSLSAKGFTTLLYVDVLPLFNVNLKEEIEKCHFNETWVFKSIWVGAFKL
jgi:hypothetical protein